LIFFIYGIPHKKTYNANGSGARRKPALWVDCTARKEQHFFSPETALGITNLNALAGRHLVAVRYALYAFLKAKMA